MEQTKDLGQFAAYLLVECRIADKELALNLGLEQRLWRRTLRLRFEKFAGTLDRVALLVQQSFDFEHQFHIFASVESMAGAGLLRTKAGKLGLPKAKNVRLDSRKARYFADPKI